MKFEDQISTGLSVPNIYSENKRDFSNFSTSKKSPHFSFFINNTKPVAI